MTLLSLCHAYGIPETLTLIGRITVKNPGR